MIHHGVGGGGRWVVRNGRPTGCERICGVDGAPCSAGEGRARGPLRHVRPAQRTNRRHVPCGGLLLGHPLGWSTLMGHPLWREALLWHPCLGHPCLRRELLLRHPLRWESLLRHPLRGESLLRHSLRRIGLLRQTLRWKTLLRQALRGHPLHRKAGLRRPHALGWHPLGRAEVWGSTGRGRLPCSTLRTEHGVIRDGLGTGGAVHGEPLLRS